MRSAESSVIAIVMVAFLLSFPLFLSQPLAASAPSNGHRLGFWLQEDNIMAQYSAQTFFDAMFLTPPYPTSVEVMIFAIPQAETNSQPCSASSSYIAGSENYWGQVAQTADSYPSIQLVFEIAFDPASSTYGLSCFQSVAQSFAPYSSVYGVGIEGEYTKPQSLLTSSVMQTAMSTVTSMGKQFVNYYLPGSLIPSGGYDIYHTNFPGGDSGGYDQVGSLTMSDSQTIGMDTGYYANYQFPGTVTCPIGPNAMNSQTAGWNQCVEQTELSTALQQPPGTRQFLELDGGFDSSGSFVGSSGQSTNQMWDNPTLRNWIWTDPSYQPNFILSTSGSSSTTTSTSSSSTSTSTTATSSATSSTSRTSSTTTTTSTHISTTSSSSTSTTGKFTLSTFVSCPDKSPCGTTSPAGSNSYPPNAVVTVTATPGTGYQFSSWLICASSCKLAAGNPLSIKLLTSGNATANFVTAGSSATTTSTVTTASNSTATSTLSSGTTTGSVYTISSTQSTSSEQLYPLSITGDCPSTGSGLYAAGSIAVVNIQAICNRSAVSGTRVTSWSLDGGADVPVLSNGTTTLLIAMNGPQVITINTVTQYAFTLDYGAQLSMLSVTAPTIPEDNYWYDSGTFVTFTGRVELQNFTATGYALDGATFTPLEGGPIFVTSFLMTGPHTLHVLLGSSNDSCPKTDCTNSPTFQVTIQTNTNTPSGTWIDNAYYPKPVTFSWEAGSAHNITAAIGMQQTMVRSSFTGWSGLANSQSRSLLFRVNETGQVTADYTKQVLVHLSFTDANGAALTPQSLVLSGPSGRHQVGSNMSAWVDQGAAYRVVSVTWMGWNVARANDSAFQVTQPALLSFSTDVYTQTLKVSDAYGLPVAGASVNATMLNGYSISVVTDGRGTAQFRAPEGLFSASVSYLGVNDQIVSSTEGSHSFSVTFVLSYPLIATLATAAGVVVATFAYFALRKKPNTGIFIFSDT